MITRADIPMQQVSLCLPFAVAVVCQSVCLSEDVYLLQIKNVTAASSAALQHDVASLQQETQEMQNKVERSLQSFETVQHEAQAVEGEVVDEVTPFILHPLLCCCLYCVHCRPSFAFTVCLLYSRESR